MGAPTTSRANDAWITGLRARDAQTIASLRDVLCRRLQGALTGKAGQSDVEDFAQLALDQIFRSLETFRGDSRLETWATAIALRTAYSELRKKRWGAVPLDDVAADGAIAAPDTLAPGGALAARSELVAALRDAIDTSLSDRQRAVVLAELRGMPLAALCDELGTTRGALYKVHHDARKKLRRALESKGFGADDLRFALEDGLV